MTEKKDKKKGNAVQLVLTVLLVGAAFAIGSMWTELKVLKGGQQSAVQQKGAVEADLVSLLKGYAEEIELDADDFSACLDEGRYTKAVQDDLALAQKIQAGGTPTFFINGYKLVGARGYESFEKVFNGEVVVDEERLEKLDDATWSDLIKDPAIVKGSEDAEIVLVEFTDYECPYCAEFAGVDVIPTRPIDEGQSYKQIVENYVETGKVKYILKDLPLHGATAIKVAEAARCAGDQGKYWEMHDKLFLDQAVWSEAELQ